jgi:hypothetical protein
MNEPKSAFDTCRVEIITTLAQAESDNCAVRTSSMRSYTSGDDVQWRVGEFGNLNGAIRRRMAIIDMALGPVDAQHRTQGSWIDYEDSRVGLRVVYAPEQLKGLFLPSDIDGGKPLVEYLFTMPRSEIR